MFGEYKAGKYPTVEKALIAAGMRAKRTPFQEMLNAWRKASAAERETFLHTIGCVVVTVGLPLTAPASSTSAALPFSVDRRLEPSAVKQLEDIMTRRDMKMGDLMAELGRKRLNASVGIAMHQGSRLQPDLLDDLEAWVAKH